MITSIKKWHLFIPVGIIAIVVALGVFMWVYYHAPSNYLTLDVNPSIEIHTNRLNQVVSVEPVNEDAKLILAGYELTDHNLETVIKNIVDRMIMNGYLSSDLDNSILVTTDENNDTAELSTDVNNILSTYLDEKQLSANIILQSLYVTADELQTAYDSKLTIGKMNLIEALVKSDSSLTVEALSLLRISDLMAIAAQRNISLEDVSDIIHIQSTDADVDANAQAQNQTPTTSIAIGEQVKGQDLEDAEDSEEQDEDQKYEASEDNDDQDYEDAEDIDDLDDDQDYKDSEDNDDQDEDQDYEDSEDNDDQDEDRDYKDSEDNDDQDEDQDYEDSEDNDDQGEDQDYEDAWENDDQEDGHAIEARKSDDQGEYNAYQNNNSEDE